MTGKRACRGRSFDRPNEPRPPRPLRQFSDSLRYFKMSPCLKDVDILRMSSENPLGLLLLLVQEPTRKLKPLRYCAACFASAAREGLSEW